MLLEPSHETNKPRRLQVSTADRNHPISGFLELKPRAC
jgi:hypothetical protein